MDGSKPLLGWYNGNIMRYILNGYVYGCMDVHCVCVCVYTCAFMSLSNHAAAVQCINHADRGQEPQWHAPWCQFEYFWPGWYPKYHLIVGERGQRRMGRLVGTDSNALYHRIEQKSIWWRATHRLYLPYNSRRARRVPVRETAGIWGCSGAVFLLLLFFIV